MSRPEIEDVLDCVVVGAGAAGLAAAAALHEAGRTFVVLEARDRIGGRAHTVRLSGGQAAERGAEYLHGARVATWEYVARFGLATHLASGPTRIGVPEFRRGEWWPAGASDSDRALQGLGAALAIPDAADVSLRDALSRAGFSGDRLRAAEGRMEVLSPIDPTVVSARSAAAAWRLVAPETACFVLVGGYGQLWDKLSRPFADRILLSSPVTALDWSPAGVTAHVGGGTFEGRTAIVTLPLGVLQSGAVAFRPHLPDRKRAAIDGLRSGAIVKVIAEFRRPFWESRTGTVPSFRAPDSPFFAFRVSFWDRPGPPTLVAFLGAASALAVTGHRERVAELLHQVLGEMFPGDRRRRGTGAPRGGRLAGGSLGAGRRQRRARRRGPPARRTGPAHAAALLGRRGDGHGRRRRVRARRADDRATGRGGSATSPAAGVGHRSDEPAGVGPVSRLSVQGADGVP